MKNFDKKFILIFIFICITLLSIYFFSKQNTYEVYSNNDLFIETNSLKTSIEQQNIVIHIVGEVTSPGIVSIPYGSRICDAIDAAGGITTNADTSKINLAFVLR